MAGASLIIDIATKPVRAALILLALFALPLSACGKYGDLEPPPSHNEPAEDDSEGTG